MSPRVVGIGECAVSRDPAETLVTYALGSCVAVAIHDPVAQVAGLLHYMLPEGSLNPEKAANKPFLYADRGVPRLFHQAYGMGAAKERLIVSAAGGAQVLDLEVEDTFNIGKRNQLQLRKLLWRAGVMLHRQDLGGTMPRNVSIQVQSGEVLVSHGREQRVLNRSLDVRVSEERVRLSHVL